MRSPLVHIVAVIGTLGIVAGPGLRAQGVQAAAPAPTRVADLGWLTGHWTGKVTGQPLDADLIFSAPSAGSIFGVARLTQGSELAVAELISLIDGKSGVELRFRHFAGDLAAYEPDYHQNMLLTAVSDSDLTFTNQVPFEKGKMATQPRVTRFIHRAGDILVGHSRIIDDNGAPAEVESVYRRSR